MSVNYFRFRKYFFATSAAGTVLGVMAVVRSYMSGDPYEGKEEMYGKTVVITGANTGIGKETAKDLAKRGARVVLACKDMKKCMEAKYEIIDETWNKSVECIKCDLASMESIREFVDTFKKSHDMLHVLVNNAGTMWHPKGYTKEGFETHFGVNHLGHFYLTNLLLPVLKYSYPSRVVVLTSRDHLKGKINFEDLNSAKNYNEEDAYNQSKLANVLFAQELSDRLKGTGVTANCVDPGYVYTDLMRYSSVYKSPYSPISFGFKMFLKTPKMGAQPVVFACVCKEIEDITGKYFRNFKIDYQADQASKEVLNKAIAVRLWATSEKWTKLNENK